MLRKFGHHLLKLPLALFLLWAALASVNWVRNAPKSVTLPNGMMFKLEYYFPGAPIALFATDGRKILARKIGFVCFDDRYVSITSYKPGDAGIYDAHTNAKVRAGERNTVEHHLMHARRKACNGYYTGLLGAVFLLDGQKYPSLLPSCKWRNLDNPALKNRAWFDRPCDEETWRNGLDPRPAAPRVGDAPADHPAASKAKGP
ncbi:hypothetical protein [Paracoccus aminovorans]|uniref:hypothetical protein n=1 Tax=Paracoccus aminovorans TaxID=34004 RepID=UPI002B25A057|nr:hypothetical protein [Paracoccus aminovorans]